MQVRHKRLEPGLVGNHQVGRHASSTSAYPSWFTRDSEGRLLGLVHPLILCGSIRIPSPDRHGRILQRQFAP